MKVVRALIIAAVCLAAASLVSPPAFAWYWPILGFGPGSPGSPPPTYTGPGTILPGTPQWACQPMTAAQLVLPGYAYGASAFKNYAGVGCVPSLCSACFGFPNLSGGDRAGNVYFG